ncbi:LysM peptidoglycan-binding domain-containing protein [Desulfovibrio sulfodismutans]|uniref:LysM peptidoglycan-binding domain-containing protein n=1 Tax=Desulfolutivibrio sulfodismutans TaxID=63561 RepID=A0A7K3NGU3_9BACT|nr:LysM peptidoglycan-binding domain-containing protein [Desulfolutivibrio sulfodismutans]NDY55398.1 LysM peptidoglycan-binding domain-containing protein [Desulfolutivibrio sulfodismutans]QLA12227.1 LysM peptidoglycan-binding domain-containing protein [Desulfolutivibrio sulfodismutans DSM 3696]
MTGTARIPFPGDLAPALAAVFLLCLLAVIFASAAQAQANPRTHVVQPGETLFSLAKRYGVSLAALQAENGIAAADQIRAGACLRLPAATAADPGPGMGGKGALAGAAGRDPAKKAAAPKNLAAKWNVHDQTSAIMGEPPKPDPPRSGSLLDVPLKGGGTLSPEHRDAGAVIMSGAANKDEDFQGHALGVRTTLPAGKDTQLVTTLGYGVNVSVKENEASRVGYETDTSIGGLGYGLGLRHSF